VIWQPNQIFEKFGREGDDPQGKSPFRFGTKCYDFSECLGNLALIEERDWSSSNPVSEMPVILSKCRGYSSHDIGVTV